MKRIAVSWFRQEDWPQWCELDPDFQPDHAHWLRRMDALFAQQPPGVTFVKVVIEPAEFMRWSKANGRGVGTLERAAFAAMKLQTGAMH